jgi:hypothetical protein
VQTRLPRLQEQYRRESTTYLDAAEDSLGFDPTTAAGSRTTDQTRALESYTSSHPLPASVGYDDGHAEQVMGTSPGDDSGYAPADQPPTLFRKDPPGTPTNVGDIVWPTLGVVGALGGTVAAISGFNRLSEAVATFDGGVGTGYVPRELSRGGAMAIALAGAAVAGLAVGSLVGIGVNKVLD